MLFLKANAQMISTKIRTFIYFSMVFYAIFLPAYASELANKVIEQLNVEKANIASSYVVEKTLPYDEGKTVIVIPIYQIEDDVNIDEAFDLDAYIIIADTITGKILHKLYQARIWTSDAISLQEITIDTGRFILNDQIRAFGIKTTYRNFSRANPFNESLLTLFIVENNRLKRVLDHLIIYSFSAENNEGFCDGYGEFFNTNKTHIEIGKLKTNNLYNLIIKQTIKEETNSDKNGVCVYDVVTSKTMKTLKYNGEKYK